MSVELNLFIIVIVLVLYLPGYFFRRFYFIGFAKQQFGMGSWYDRFFLSIFFGFLLQYLSLAIIDKKVFFSVDDYLAPVAKVFFSNPNSMTKEDFRKLFQSIIHLFFAIIYGGAVGYFLHKLTVFTKADVKSSALKFANSWYYYFWAKIIRDEKFRRFNQIDGHYISTRAEILVASSSEDKKLLYRGVLYNFDVSEKTTCLERIYLIKASVFKNADNTAEGDGFVSIPGDIFMINAHQILSINLSYDFVNRSIKPSKYATFFQKYSSIVLLFITAAAPIAYLFFSKASFLNIFIAWILTIFSAIVTSSLFSIINDRRDLTKHRFFSVLLTFIFLFAILVFLISRLLIQSGHTSR